MTAGLSIGLPHGWAGEERMARAAVVPVDGGAELRLADLAEAGTGAAWVTELLATAVDELDHAAARRLVAGDREALVLAARWATLGDRLDLVATCAHCEDRLDLELRVPDLLLPPYADAAPWYDERVKGAGRVRFRLPTGGDQEAVASLAESDPEAAVAELLARCVDGDVPDDPRGRAALAVAMEAHDPQAGIVLTGVCALCRRPVHAPLDAAAVLAHELEAPGSGLIEQVHTLASHYHWTEDVILALPGDRRRRYLDLVLAGT